MSEHSSNDPSQIQLPAPTFWPMVFAFGITLLLAGIVTHWAVSIVGFLIAAKSATGWWKTVIPNEAHEGVSIETERRPAAVKVGLRSVVRLKIGEGGHRVRVPEKIHPYSSGFWGGLAGGAVMAALACLYGLIAYHSVWYPVNLLAGVVIPDMGTETVQQLSKFNMLAFIAASVGHLSISILVGVLYAVMLPMFPKYAAFWAGILMPVFWSGLVATTLNFINPALNSRISWPWFVVCQLGFGLVGGYVIARSTSISTMQTWTLAERAFLEVPHDEDHK